MPLTLVIMITIIVMIIIIIIIIIIIKTDFNFFLWENILNFTFLIFMIYMAVLNC